MLIECPKCKARVDGQIYAQLGAYPEDEPYYQVSLLRCPSCLMPLIGYQDFLGFDPFDSGASMWTAESSRVWPFPSINLPHSIPTAIRNSLEESDKCIRAGAFTASISMSGRALEAMCRHFNTKSQYLSGGLKELLDREIIDKRIYQWGEELRKNRNLAAHATDENFTHNDAEDQFNFTTAICDYVFVLNEKFDAYMKRRNGKNK